MLSINKLAKLALMACLTFSIAGVGGATSKKPKGEGGKVNTNSDGEDKTKAKEPVKEEVKTLKQERRVAELLKTGKVEVDKAAKTDTGTNAKPDKAAKTDAEVSAKPDDRESFVHHLLRQIAQFAFTTPQKK